jgi:hypothetical protein
MFRGKKTFVEKGEFYRHVNVHAETEKCLGAL